MSGTQQRSRKATTAGLASTLIDAHFTALLERGFTETRIDWMAREGYVRSVSWEEVRDGVDPFGRRWIELFPSAKQTRTGGLMLAFDPQAPFPTYSLRCDVPPVKKEVPLGEPQVSKYLYARSAGREWSEAELEANPGRRLRPFVPNGVMGPTGESLGNAPIATEGLLDALYCTLVIGVPCVGLTAPSHLGQSPLPKGCSIYIGDCDQALARGLLQQVLDHVRRRSMKCARLPFRAAYLDDYLNRPHDLPNEAKAGMEELGKDHGPERAKEILAEVIKTAAQPAVYLRWEIRELAKLGIRWGQNHDVCTGLMDAAASAAPRNVAHSAQLIEDLKQEIRIPVGAAREHIKNLVKGWAQGGRDLHDWREDPSGNGHSAPFAKGPDPEEEEGEGGAGEGEAVRFGHIAFTELYGNGLDYRTVGASVYKFNGVHYEHQPREQLTKEAMAFALTYPVADAKGNISHPFATSASANEAINVLMMSTATETTRVNPSGYVNCENCVLKLVPTGPNGTGTRVEEIPHSRDLIFIDPPGCKYDPDADPSHYNRLMTCLEPNQAAMLMEVFGASFDVQRARRCAGRIPAVMLAGGGQNGKDTTLTPPQEIIGRNSVTGVTMSNYIQFDRGEGAGRFAVATLAHSRINVGGENTKAFKLENVESVKCVITGDPLRVEEKKGHPFTIYPQTVSFFNFNDLPNMDAVRAATTTRFVIVSFDKTFSANPDLAAGELPIDTRFKEDPEWRRENVLPAYLNAMLAGLQRVLGRGSFDCSSGAEAMQAARENSTHLWQLVREIGLEKSEPWQEVRLKDVWARMVQWYVGYGYARWEDGGLSNHSDGARPRRFLPEAVRDGDRLILRSNEVVDTLRKRMFPAMKTRTARGGAVVIVGFTLKFPIPGEVQG